MTDDNGDEYGILLTPLFVKRYSRAFRRLAIANLVFVCRFSDQKVVENLDDVTEDERQFAVECQSAAQEQRVEAAFDAALREAAESITCLSDPQIRGLALKHLVGNFRGRAAFSDLATFLIQERTRITASPSDVADHFLRLMEKFPGTVSPCRNQENRVC